MRSSSGHLRGRAGTSIFGAEKLVDLPDVIEFSASHTYCKEDEGRVQLEVLRQGACTGFASVDFYTKDGSAKAGKRFVDTRGTLHFAPNERAKTFEIELIEDDAFDTTLDFDVILENPSGAQLGLYLWKATIPVLDDDAFPTNRFKADLQSGDLRHVNSTLLMVEYLRFNFQDPVLRGVSIRNFIFDQFANFKYAWSLFVTNYILDEIVRTPSGELPEGHEMAILGCVAALLVPEFLTVILDRQRAFRRVQGKAINRLQANMLRKYMNYDDNSRQQVSTSDLTMAITRDVPDLVQTGFMRLFHVVQQLGLLITLLGLNIYQTAPHSPVLTAFMIFGFPMVALTFFTFRHPGSYRRHRRSVTCETKAISTVKQTTDNFRLIADYNQLSTAIDIFAKKVADLNGAYTDEAVWETLNQNFVPAMTTVCMLLYVGFNYQDAVDGGSLPIGKFITGIALWRSVGACYQQLYIDVLKMHQAITSLENIVYYMNLSVDVRLRCAHFRAAHETADLMYKEANSWCRGEVVRGADGAPAHSVWPRAAEAALQSVNVGGNSPSVNIARQLASFNEGKPVDKWTAPFYIGDLMPMYGRGITYAYPVSTGGGTRVLNNTDFRIPQGKLVVVTGERGGGKATVLNLLGKVILLNNGSSNEGEGMLFVPPHLRVLHVGAAQTIPELTLWQNLCFGPSDGEDESADRILAICRRLGMSEDVLKVLEAEAIADGNEIDQLPVQGLPSMASCASAATPVGSQPSAASPKKRVLGTFVVPPEEMRGTAGSVVSRERQKSAGERLLSHTDKCLIHIARALVMNPEILILHKPLAHFDDVHGQVLLEMLREYVDQRGILKDPETRLSRRPCSCIFSVASTRGTEVADVVLHVGAGEIEQVDVERLQHLRVLARQLFDGLDLEGVNRLSISAFTTNMPGAPFAKELLGVDEQASKAELEALFKTVAGSKSALLEFEELVRFIRRRISETNVDVLTVGEYSRHSYYPRVSHHPPTGSLDEAEAAMHNQGSLDEAEAAMHNQGISVEDGQSTKTTQGLGMDRSGTKETQGTWFAMQSPPAEAHAVRGEEHFPENKLPASTWSRTLQRPALHLDDGRCKLFC